MASASPTTITAHALLYTSSLTSPHDITCAPRRVSSRREILAANAPCAYTALTTTRGRSGLPQLRFHAARLARGGLELLLPRASKAVGKSDGSGLMQPLLFAVSTAVRAYSVDESNACDSIGSELNVAIFLSDKLLGYDIAGLDSLISPIAEAGDLWLHVILESQFPATGRNSPSLPQSVVVEARGKPREQAFVKNTAWIRGREGLEAARAADSSETILLGGNGASQGASLLEGTVTNFYVIMRDETLWTACDDSVLCGSVQRVVLDAAAALGIQVVGRAPCVRDMVQFDAAFLTNAVIMLTPVSIIRFPTLDDIQDEFHLPMSDAAIGIVNALRKKVDEMIEAESSALIA
jgi:hypothetical protein